MLEPGPVSRHQEDPVYFCHQLEQVLPLGYRSKRSGVQRLHRERPEVHGIARKVSLGSSFKSGAETRSVLMSVVHTLNKRHG